MPPAPPSPITVYDGPPFATGLPHYGHLLAGTIKDTVTRYYYQTGHHVERRFGWDCHGLPVEYEIDKSLGIAGQREKVTGKGGMGIAKYNEACRAIVMRYSKEWEKTVTRMGRWIDFDNDYKTMDASFMESVWWVFSQLFQKKLVYRGFKVMPYSTACSTPLSNFESNQNYQDVKDPAIVISFPLVNDADVSFLAWTTTPWTLPSNLALCVNPASQYVRVRDLASGRVWIVMEARLPLLDEITKRHGKGKGKKDKKKAAQSYEVLETMKGSDLAGIEYVPLFEFFRKKPDGTTRQWKVVADGYVTSESGTGIVHCAPAFGEDDYRVCMANKVIVRGEPLVCPVDDNGRFTADVTDWAGIDVKTADRDIILKLKEAGRMIDVDMITHSYPFCWRSNTPLIYKAVPSWFVSVETFHEQVIDVVKETKWVPDFVKSGRFINWLANARDWCVSRNRFWGTPLPLWVSDDMEEVVCVGSIEELEALTGAKVTDLHREHVDGLTIPSKQGKGTLHRIEEVFDCWFESGSMPYSQMHYPFENKAQFEAGFPADFIAEGLDQTRGWFYTLMVLSTAVSGKPAFKNVVVNGLVLAEDGHKMSKSLKNYPDPSSVIGKTGADSLRLYLLNSPAVRAEPLRFKEEGVKEVVRGLFIPWHNAYRFLVQNIRLRSQTTGTPFCRDLNKAVQSKNIMDQWILGSANSLLKTVHVEMEKYQLYNVTQPLVYFLEDLTNWYVKLNRARIKGVDVPHDDSEAALNTLLEVLLLSCIVMAPFTPFIVESMYQNLKCLLPTAEQQDSIHYMMIPKPTHEGDAQALSAVATMKQVIKLGRLARDKKGIGLKMPLKHMEVVVQDEAFFAHLGDVSPYIREELNIRVIDCKESRPDLVLQLQPVFSVLGKKLGKKFSGVSAALKQVKTETVHTMIETGSAVIGGEPVSVDEVVISCQLEGVDSEHLHAESSGRLVVVLDFSKDEGLADEGVARELVNRINRMRKRALLKVEQFVEVFYDQPDEGPIARVLNGPLIERVKTATRGSLLPSSEQPEMMTILLEEVHELPGGTIRMRLVRDGPCVARRVDGLDGPAVELFLRSMDPQVVTARLKDGPVKVTVDGKDATLVLGANVFLTAAERQGK